MQVYSPARRLPTRRLSLLLAALIAAAVATLASSHLIAPEPRSTAERVTATGPPAHRRAVSGTSTPNAKSDQTKTVPEPDERRALFLYILDGFAGHPILKEASST